MSTRIVQRPRPCGDVANSDWLDIYTVRRKTAWEHGNTGHFYKPGFLCPLPKHSHIINVQFNIMNAYSILFSIHQISSVVEKGKIFATLLFLYCHFSPHFKAHQCLLLCIALLSLESKLQSYSSLHFKPLFSPAS